MYACSKHVEFNKALDENEKEKQSSLQHQNWGSSAME